MKTLCPRAVAAIALVSGVAHADDGGSVKVTSGNSAWIEVSASDAEIALNARGQVKTASKVFLHRPADGLPLAILKLTSDKAGSGGVRVQWTQKCPEPKGRLFTDDYGTRSSPQKNECLVVSDRYSTTQFLKANEAVARALSEQGLSLQSSVSAISSSVTTRYGRLVNLLLIIQGGSSAQAQDQLLQQLIDIGRSWHTAVRDATFSVSGELRLPALPSNL